MNIMEKMVDNPELMNDDDDDGQMIIIINTK
jgi:hypothetical protein